MPIATETKTFDPAPAGTHIARCFGCISLGTQVSPEYPTSFKILLLFELPLEMLDMPEGPMPMTVHKEYTLSLGKKANLRKHLDSWRGRAFTEEELAGFEVSKVVGAPCQLTIIHKLSAKGSTYANIESITGLPKGTTCPPQNHVSVKYEIEEGNSLAFQKLPEWIQKKIQACEEWRNQPTTTRTPIHQAARDPRVDKMGIPLRPMGQPAVPQPAEQVDQMGIPIRELQPAPRQSKFTAPPANEPPTECGDQDVPF